MYAEILILLNIWEISGSKHL